MSVFIVGLPRADSLRYSVSRDRLALLANKGHAPTRFDDLSERRQIGFRVIVFAGCIEELSGKFRVLELLKSQLSCCAVSLIFYSFAAIHSIARLLAQCPRLACVSHHRHTTRLCACVQWRSKRANRNPSQFFAPTRQHQQIGSRQSCRFGIATGLQQYALGRAGLLTYPATAQTGLALLRWCSAGERVGDISPTWMSLLFLI